MQPQKQIYDFYNDISLDDSKIKDILGGKGAALAEMSRLGISVPPGFTISTEVCLAYHRFKKNNSRINSNLTTASSLEANTIAKNMLEAQLPEAMMRLEKQMHKQFGGNQKPLLVSVRSGAKVSMPGMMDTILNLGLNDITVEALAQETQNPRFAYDCYRRLIQMYGSIVLDIEHYEFDELLTKVKNQNNIHSDGDLSVESLKLLVNQYKDLFISHRCTFPQNVYEQLWGAIYAVLASWESQRANKYREVNNISATIGTAVNIQAMVFGNIGEKSGTGVMFTRNPSTGVNHPFGEFMINAQGEDVVAGIRNTLPISNQMLLNSYAQTTPETTMEKLWPEIFQELVDVGLALELHYKDMQDIEFTIEQGKLWILQTRSGKRSGKATIKIAVDMVKSGIISISQSLAQINPDRLNSLLHPTIDSSSKTEIIAKGLPASPGAVFGVVAFSSSAVERLAINQPVIMVRNETSPDDINGMVAAAGILTARGGMTSHAAVVARGMGKVCVCGVNTLAVDYKNNIAKIGNYTIKEGDLITIDGTAGQVFLGQIKTSQAGLDQDFQQIMQWSDQQKKLGVRANAETEQDLKTAFDFGAEGVGLCRTEHMFFSSSRIFDMRRMIMAETKEARNKTLNKLFEYQQNDFYHLFKIAKDRPFTIRLLDPPLHEFLPQTEEELTEFATSAGLELQDVHQRVEKLKEVNPMLGHRGCRLALTYPEIYEMQIEAIFTAIDKLLSENEESSLYHSTTLAQQQATKFNPEIMIPLAFSAKEITYCKELCEKKIKSLNLKHTIPYKFGAMIELPRAALEADEIAKIVDFCSFGTNDLTQTTLGISRDDSGMFLGQYIEHQMIQHDPFMTIDDGVGQLVKIAAEKARKANPKIKLGICGEHGGDQTSINFFHHIGLDYVSCSPYRVPVARLSAAQATIMEKQN